MIDFQWNGYEFKIVQYGEGIFKKDMAGHSHSKNSYELHYITGGKGKLTTDCKVYELSRGDFFITGPEIYHQQSTSVDGPLQEVYIYLQTNGKKSNDLSVATFLSTHFYFGENLDLQKYFDLILQEKEERKLGCQTVQEAQI